MKKNAIYYLCIVGLLILATATLHAQEPPKEKHWNIDNYLGEGSLRIGIDVPLKRYRKASNPFIVHAAPFMPLSMNVEYFIDDKIALYASPRFGQDIGTYPVNFLWAIPPDVQVRALTLGGEFGANYYFLKKGRWAAFGLLGGQIDYHQYRVIGGMQQSEMERIVSLSAKAGLGVDFFITKRLAVGLKLPIIFTHTNHATVPEFVGRVRTIQPTFGVKYRFGRP